MVKLDSPDSRAAIDLWFWRNTPLRGLLWSRRTYPLKGLLTDFDGLPLFTSRGVYGTYLTDSPLAWGTALLDGITPCTMGSLFDGIPLRDD